MSVSKARMIFEQCEKSYDFFCEQILGLTPWSVQSQIAKSVEQNRITAVKSCHASGKTHTAAGIVLRFVATHRPSKVITTAPTDRQVRLILWSEIATAYNRAKLPLGGRLLTQELHFDKDHFAVGFATRNYDPDALQGYHSKNAILIVMDEADGITPEVRDGVDSLMSSGHARLLEIGNPINPSSRFAGRFTERGVSTITISAFDTPNFTFFGITREDIETGAWKDKVADRDLPRPYLITPQWVSEMYERSGRSWDDPFVQSRVLGQFPTEDAYTLFPLAKIEDAYGRALGVDAPKTPVLLACDVARYGDDKTIIVLRRGMHAQKVFEISGQNTSVTANQLLFYQAQYGATEIRVDDDGVGGGVTDSLQEKIAQLGRECQVVPMRGGTSAVEDERFANSRAEWHWQLKLQLQEGLISIDPEWREVSQQLPKIRISRFDSKGRLLVTPKEEIKKDTGRSPDDSDTLVYAFANVNTGPAPVLVV